jgi:hypothetical protein
MTRYIVQWVIVTDPYDAPECKSYVLHGRCNCMWITSTPIVEVLDDDCVRTKSGNLYKLIGDGSSVIPSGYCQLVSIRELKKALELRRRQK